MKIKFHSGNFQSNGFMLKSAIIARDKKSLDLEYRLLDYKSAKACAMLIFFHLGH